MEKVSIPWHEGEINVEIELIGEAGDPSVGLRDSWRFEEVYYNGILIENLRPEIYELLTDELIRQGV